MSLFSHTRPLRRADIPATGTPTGVGYALIGQVRAVTTCPPRLRRGANPRRHAGPLHVDTAKSKMSGSSGSILCQLTARQVSLQRNNTQANPVVVVVMIGIQAQE